MLKNIRPAQWVLTGLTVLCLLLAVVAYLTDTLTSVSEVMLVSRHKQGVGMLTPDTPAAQTFIAGQSNLAAVEVMASNYNKKVSEGTLTVWMTDESGAELARLEKPVGEWKNNTFLTLELAKPIAGSQGKAYTLYATSDCVEEKGVTLRMGPIEGDAAGLSLTLADGTQDPENALNLRLRYNVISYGMMSCATMLLLAISFAACIPMAKGKERA